MYVYRLVIYSHYPERDNEKTSQEIRAIIIGAIAFYSKIKALVSSQLPLLSLIEPVIKV